MPYELSIDDESGIVQLGFTGNSTIGEHEISRDKLARLLDENGLRRAIVDMTKEESFMKGSTLHLFDFGCSLASAVFSRGVKLAVVDENGSKSDVDFVVTVASNRGFVVQLFTDTARAIEWLVGLSKDA
jgi:hypothetical protein